MTVAVPPLLADPPWARGAGRPTVITGLTCSEPAAVRWGPGEREEWSAAPVADPDHRSWHMLTVRVSGGVAGWTEQASLFAHGPDDVVRPMLAGWHPEAPAGSSAVLRRVAARFELDALPPLLYAARRRPDDHGDLLRPFWSPELAQAMAEGLSRKTFRGVAEQWLGQRAPAAARALVPAALRRPGAARRHAEWALLALHDGGHGDAVRAAAAGYGDRAAAAIETLLGTDRATLAPARMPAVPAWAAVADLPPVRLRDGGALPDAAVANLLQALALSRLDEPCPGLMAAIAELDRASLAAFAGKVFTRWEEHGAAAKDNWALETLGLTGDDETVRRLTPLILGWPGRNGARAVTAVSALAAIGTEVALEHLYRITREARHDGPATAAAKQLGALSAVLHVTREELADRLVPDLGLDDHGSMTLDYGPRQFTVGFDEQLRPYVQDAAGRRLKALPKPGLQDDAQLAAAAQQAFTRLKKEVRTTVTGQLRRLERAMLKRGRWYAAGFRRFVRHPLNRHIARRLVWGVYDASGALTGAVRVAEDLSLATVDDEEATLTDDTLVGVAHPLELGDSLPYWGEVLADYEIMQPFPQLARTSHTPTAEEVAAGRLVRFDGAVLPDHQAAQLEYRGWIRDRDLIEFEVGGRRTLVVKLTTDAAARQCVGDIYLTGQPPLPVTSADPIGLSDVIRHLSEVTR